MSEILEPIYEIENLAELEIFLRAQDQILIRERLLGEFDRYAFYKNASEWNRAVKICECLAIIGWGERESLEALRGKFYNGYAMTYFLNVHGEPRFVEAMWSKRKTGLTMQDGDTFFHESPNAAGKTLSRPVKEDIQDVKIKQPAQLDSQKSGPHHARYQQLLRKLARRDRKPLCGSTTSA